ncbi:MAG: geranylgeranylglyceryl/heptaprenylglyceryl phosphate synthase [Bacteroidetes bacterium]|nr:geranylgeranylglyceryl/heptaprenylglyceryl phosphate synthase [Bacteroidota bacterium]
MLGKNKHTKLIILIDPDKFNPALLELAAKSKVSCFFIGGSHITSGNFEKTVRAIKKKSRKPLIIFPGDATQVSSHADGLLLLSLISGRNPDYLIGIHVEAARKLKRSGLAIFPTGYILVGGGSVSTTQKITNTLPLKATEKAQIIDTALAGELLGMKLIYLEAGSGAKEPVPVSLIRAVKKNLSVPLIVGGGIDSVAKARQVISSGADYLVVGNALETNPAFLNDLNSLF